MPCLGVCGCMCMCVYVCMCACESAPKRSTHRAHSVHFIWNALPLPSSRFHLLKREKPDDTKRLADRKWLICIRSIVSCFKSFVTENFTIIIHSHFNEKNNEISSSTLSSHLNSNFKRVIARIVSKIACANAFWQRFTNDENSITMTIKWLNKEKHTTNGENNNKYPHPKYRGWKWRRFSGRKVDEAK